MRSRINLLRRRRKVHIGPARSWPFPTGKQENVTDPDKPVGQTFVDYIKKVIERQEQKNLERAYDQAKRVVDEQR